ncbi:MAG: hypothetical protein IT316_09840 [Anaerolineales bacterium]|nr:hypothetical protein [Anaerolineales bacterium]
MEKIPTIKLNAVASGRRLVLDRLGVPIVLAFLWVDTQYLAEEIDQAVRERYPEASQVLVANVASLRGVPGIFRGLAEGEMKKAYKETAAKLPAGRDPADYVIILPDWKSECARALGLRDISSKPAVAVLDGAGGIVGVHQGEPDTLRDAALSLLEMAVSEKS